MLLLASLALSLWRISCASRIIGGHFASPGQFPHQISLQLKGRHHCGGSLISDTYIVTAAHCTSGVKPSQLHVIVGTTDLSAGDGKPFQVAELFVHSHYNRHTQDYDISLIKLSSSVPLGGHIQSIKMTSAGTNYPANTIATISGFGAVNGNLEFPNKLKFARVQLWSRDFCNPRNIPGVTDRMICAGHPNGQVNACPGDSGGPLTVDDKLVGIVSWGFGCGVRGKPAIYTFVGALRSWIKEISGV